MGVRKRAGERQAPAERPSMLPMKLETQPEPDLEGSQTLATSPCSERSVPNLKANAGLQSTQDICICF
jgi:hypothetical protein